MNLRTIRLWAIYDPAMKHIIMAPRTKRQAQEQLRDYPHCVLVEMKGHYVKKLRGPQPQSPKEKP